MQTAPFCEAMGLLERLLQAAEAGGRTGSVIEILVLQALAHQAQGDIPAALVPLERALTLAEPEGYVRMFVDEGPPMAQLLREAAARGSCQTIQVSCWRHLTKLMQQTERRRISSPRSAGAMRPRLRSPSIEPLSQRELEVLRLFKTELSGPEIAR